MTLPLGFLCVAETLPYIDSNLHNHWRGFKSVQLVDILSVSTAGSVSFPANLFCGVLQGSVLGPILFSIYMLPVSYMISKYKRIQIVANLGELTNNVFNKTCILNPRYTLFLSFEKYSQG